MRKLFGGLVSLAAVFALAVAGSTAAGISSWGSSVAVSNQVASSPTTGGGYPVPAGSTAPVAGTCRNGGYDANHSESWIAVKPGTENLVGSSKFFFENFSTFYMFHLGAYTILNGAPAGNGIVQGYDCVTTGTQDMPPSWTDTTDPNLAFDTQGRVFQTMLPFNAFWANLHPNGAIDMSFSDNLGASWVKGNGGNDLELSPNESSLSFGHFEDKQWVAVDESSVSRFRDSVYATWSLFNGFSVEVRFAFSRDHGQTFSPATTITLPQQVGPATTFALDSVDAAGNVYVSIAGFPANGALTPATLFVARSTDGGVTFGPWVQVAVTPQNPNGFFPNTRFRDGITESFAASPTFPGHLYMTFEQWDGDNENVYFTQSTDGGLTWASPVKVNDNTNEPTDQFQPSVAAGPNGAVAVAFYDRRQACPNTKSVLPADVGRTNFCINVSLQPFKDAGSGAVPVGGNVRISQFTWDPEQPGQHLGGLSQYPCAGHNDPCPAGTGFIGDYFGLAISNSNIYSLFTSTHYPSDVTADEGGPVYYQQQVLATLPRSDFGSGY
jgi:hypothetical protein